MDGLINSKLKEKLIIGSRFYLPSLVLQARVQYANTLDIPEQSSRVPFYYDQCYHYQTSKNFISEKITSRAILQKCQIFCASYISELPNMFWHFLFSSRVVEHDLLYIIHLLRIMYLLLQLRSNPTKPLDFLCHDCVLSLF